MAGFSDFPVHFPSSVRAMIEIWVSTLPLKEVDAYGAKL